MRIFIAGGTGAIGRQLVPMLIHDGHHVVGLTRSPAGAARLEAMGASAAIADVFDTARLDEALRQADAEIVIHQLTAFGATNADPLEETIRIRTQGTRNLVQAAQKSNARRFITQSISFICRPAAGGLTDESTPLYLDAPPAIRPLAQAVAELEHQTLHSEMQGVVLRYGWFYGPGTNYDPTDTIPRAIKKGRMAIVGEGNGTYSFVHVTDAASATMKALTDAPPGIYNIVDDDPAKLREWLPIAAQLLDGPPPTRMEEQLAREKLGDMLVYIFNEQAGASNAKARNVLGWQPRISSWRQGFRSLYASE